MSWCILDLPADIFAHVYKKGKSYWCAPKNIPTISSVTCRLHPVIEYRSIYPGLHCASGLKLVISLLLLSHLKLYDHSRRPNSFQTFIAPTAPLEHRQATRIRWATRWRCFTEECSRQLFSSELWRLRTAEPESTPRELMSREIDLTLIRYDRHKGRKEGSEEEECGTTDTLKVGFIVFTFRRRVCVIYWDTATASQSGTGKQHSITFLQPLTVKAFKPRECFGE